MISLSAVQRIRAFCFGVIAIVYYFAARNVASHAAAGLASADWLDPVERLLTLFLLLLGYGVMAYVFQRQQGALRRMGLVRRLGWSKEFGVGAALGWGSLLVAILPTALIGGFYVTVWAGPRQWWLLLLDTVVLLLLAVIQEVVYRGYPFQRLIDALGPSLATFSIALFAAVLEFWNPFAPRGGVWVAFFLNWLLCLGYLRTRALWLTIGFHFAWYASMGLLFGLPIGGVSRYSPVIQTVTRAPEWLTGGDYGPEAAAFTALVLIFAFAVMVRVTREYAHRYAIEEIVPAGLPVDIDAIAKRQHERGMGPGQDQNVAATPSLVQIGGVPAAAPLGSFHAPSSQGLEGTTVAPDPAEVRNEEPVALPSVPERTPSQE